MKLYLNGTFVRQENIAPYEWGAGDVQLTNMAAGSYTLKAVAEDDKGKTSEATIAVTVNAPGTIVVNAQISSSSDDTEDRFDGSSNHLTGTTLELKKDHIGL